LTPARHPRQTSGGTGMGAAMIERRQVSWKRLFLRHWLWVPLFPLIFGLVFGTVGAVLLNQAAVLERDGVDAVAVITHRSIRTERDRDGNSQTRYRLHYSFSPTSDQTVEGVQDVGNRFYNSVQVGQEVSVRFLPRDPGVNALEPPGRVMPAIFLAIGLIAEAVALLLVWVLGRNKLSLIRAARQGEVREARVTGHEPTNTIVNGRTQYRFLWLDAVGAAGRSAMTDYRDLPAVDSVVTIYVDPRSGRGWWEGDF
jgi:hypothetical protein